MYDVYTSQAAFAHLGHPVNVYSPIKSARSLILVNGYQPFTLSWSKGLLDLWLAVRPFGKRAVTVHGAPKPYQKG